MTPPPLFGPMTLIQHFFFLAGFPYHFAFFVMKHEDPTILIKYTIGKGYMYHNQVFEDFSQPNTAGKWLNDLSL